MSKPHQDARAQLWASVYASSYQYLLARAAVCYRPDYDRPNPSYGVATHGAHEYAEGEAERAVKIFNARFGEPP